MNQLPQGLRRPASQRDLALNFHQTGEIRLTLSGVGVEKVTEISG